MKSALGTTMLVSSLVSVLAVPEWGQCGGQNHAGNTMCDAGLVCIVMNPFYSQCLKPISATTSAATSTTTSKVTSATVKPTTTSIITTTKASTTTTSSSAPTSTGFIKASGQRFTLNGSVFPVVGSNAYWMAQLATDADITKAFSDLKASGLTTLRTWGFNDVTSPSGTYYNLWSGSTATLNTGASGLGRFDVVVAAAKA